MEYLVSVYFILFIYFLPSFMNSLQQKSQVAFKCELDPPRIEVTQCTVSKNRVLELT